MLVVGIALGVFLGLFTRRAETFAAIGQVRGAEEGKYRFINPLLECDIAKGVIDTQKTHFGDDLERFMERDPHVLAVADVAVYFRDLNNGPTFGVDINEPFIPASLLKVPVMMAWFAASENDSGALDRMIAFPAKIPSPEPGTQLILPRNPLVPGRIYRAEELIEHAITQSDNQAVALLIEHIPARSIRNLYEVLGVPDAVLDGPDGRLSVKQYSTFFRILFNASYLDHRNSEKALELLSRTEFDRGIVAGVPTSTRVAHKFGEAGTMDEHQIHDCGIVYYPNHPYLLCIMTRGGEIEELEEAIIAVSRFVYENVDAAYYAE